GLHVARGKGWRSWSDAGCFADDHKVALTNARAWAKQGSDAASGWENYVTLTTLAMAQEANGLTADAAKTRAKALSHPSATPLDLHQYARALLQQGKKQEAFDVWQLNAKRFGDAWP